MLSKWPIRNKLLVGIGLLLVIVATLSWSGFHAVYSYRGLVRSLSSRSSELPLASALSQQVSDLRVTLSELRGKERVAATNGRATSPKQFANDFLGLEDMLDLYRQELRGNDEGDTQISDNQGEWLTVHKIEDCLARIQRAAIDPGWLASQGKAELVRRELELLQSLSAELPSYLHERFHELAGEVRTQYRTLIVLTWITTLSAAGLLGLFIKLFYNWVFRPMRLLIQGSRRVAAGQFNHRIRLDTHDEMSELADAMNDMTARFQAIRDDLDRQVQVRTKQVVRSEQLASVGFLAAGVAHEINNPLASIAMCAESLEGRVQELLGELPFQSQQQQVIGNYLRMIQTEAFRCKGITERLLDFSRIGDVKRHDTDLRELVCDVIEMVAHLGKYQDKRIEFVPGAPVIAPVNSQELKQVVLNLITNGLDSLPSGGSVKIELARRRSTAEITFTDNGCGMTEEVLEHLFEPFFTRRRTGQGIGLGLSITYRIVADHEGSIDAHSDGPDKGSRFRVVLPLAASQQKELSHRNQAA